jgi:hypothetical protein
MAAGMLGRRGQLPDAQVRLSCGTPAPGEPHATRRHSHMDDAEIIEIDVP